MSSYYTWRTVKARKRHECATCNQPAALPGDVHTYVVHFGDGRVATLRQCPPCLALASKVSAWLDWPDEGIGQDDYAECANEIVRVPGHPDHDKAVAYLARIGALS